jgi:N-acetylmuramoyl-L-alanine amidase-like protein
MVSLTLLALAGLLPHSVEPPGWPDADWQVLDTKVRWAVARRLDTLPVGAAIARLGETFVGTTYTPGTLEAPGPERVVINLRELDCVTFIENLLALTRFIRADGVAALANRPAAEARYAGYLQDIRYRGGRLDGYPSRLHYFSEWLTDNAERGRLKLLARKLGGVQDPEPLSFMSTHPKAYRQLAEPGVAEAIAAMERRLNSGPARWYIPEDRIASVAERIQDGDLIAATSTLAGLDIAHTGIALWQGGQLYLLHAPLVGKSVEISVLPLAQRILHLKAQDGIMVARVLR